MQYSKTVILAAIASLASAAITSELSAVSSQASVLSSLVSAFQASNGLLGALTIQSSYSEFSNAVVTLNRAGYSANIAEVNAASEQLVSFFTQVTSLLDALTSRAGDLTSVGAGSIVGDDIDNLGKPSSGFVSELTSIGQGDCVLLKSFSAGMSSLSSAFSVAAVTYGKTDPVLPTYACTGSNSAAAASAGTSATSSAAAASSSASSAASSSSKAASSSKSSSSNSSAASVSSQNNAVVPAVGVAAGVAGVAAFLL